MSGTEGLGGVFGEGEEGTMKIKKRDERMCRLLSAVKGADTYKKRYGLYSLGQSLMLEYLDLKVGDVEKELGDLEEK